METRVKEGRTALAITILLIATLTVPTVLLGNGLFGLANAQQSPSPQGTAPQIELLNPSDYTSPRPMISDKDKNAANDASNDDPNDEKYHFNAWVRNAPQNATVEFFIVQGNNTASLGLGQFVGADTYELYSAIPDTFTDLAPAPSPAGSGTNGQATVRAVLYSGASEVDRDEQDVVINQTTEAAPANDALMQGERRATNRAETLEITYPANGGGVGFFGSPAARSAQIEVTTSDAAGATGGPEKVRVFYTLSWPGTDPDWEECGTETEADSSNGVKCTLDAEDSPEWVTGIAAVTVDEEDPENSPGGVQDAEVQNSGDAHRSVGYLQVPSAVNVDTGSGSASAPGCSPLMSALVSDQNGRKVVGAPVDVHAQGPGDNLAFNTDTTETSATNQTMPDENDPPENHSQESGRKCADNTLVGTQGSHTEAGALPDRKHIESTDGTGADGRFTWKLYSDIPGGTTITAWVDNQEEDDQRCPNEASGNGTFTWGNGGPAAPQPSGPDRPTCTGSSASSSASTSASSSTSTSASASSASSASTSRPSSASPSSASPSSGSPSSASPSRSASTGTTGSATTTTSTTASPQKAGVEVSLEASQPRKTFGKSFTLSGTVISTSAACTDLVNVRIMRDVVGGEDEFELFAQELTDADGAFSVTERADRSASYVAQVSETTSCDDASSSPQTVLVRVKVSLNLSRSSVQPGARVRFRIKTAPCPATARDKVLLFRAIQGEFGKAGRARTSKSCAATIVRRVSNSAVFQARWPKQNVQFLAGKSRSKAVRVTN